MLLMLRATVQARVSRLVAAASVVVALCLLALVAEGVACRIARLAAKRFIQLIRVTTEGAVRKRTSRAERSATSDGSIGNEATVSHALRSRRLASCLSAALAPCSQSACHRARSLSLALYCSCARVASDLSALCWAMRAAACVKSCSR